MPEVPTSSTTMATGDRADKTPPTFPADLETLLELTTNAAARSVDYLLVHEQSFKLIEYLTEFHTAIAQAREQLRQVTKHPSMKAPVAESQPEKSPVSQRSSENAESIENMGSTEGSESTESTEESTESTAPHEATDHGDPEGASDVDRDANSVQLSDTALQLFLDKKETVAPLSGMWGQLFDMTKEQKRGTDGMAAALVESGRGACVSDTPAQRNDDNLREGNAKVSTAYSEEPLPTLVRLMNRLAPVIVEIGPQLKAMAAAAKAEEGEPEESSDTTASKHIAKWCTCGQHTEDNDEPTSTKGDSGEEEESVDPISSHLRKVLKGYKDFTERIAEDPDLRKDIIETIASKCEGIETVANIHLARVSRTLTVKGAREVLFALPLGSAETYALVMRDIEKHEPPDRVLAKKALLWLTNSLRPLTVSELLHALNPGLSYHVSKVGDFTAKIKRLCGALFELGPSPEIVFIDPTVKEYLKTNSPDLFSDFHWSMAHDCMEYFSLPEFAKGCAESLNERTEKFPFLDYAAHNWARHCRRVSPDKTQQMRKFVVKFLSQPKKTASAIQVIQAKVWGNTLTGTSDQLGFFKSQASKRILVAAFFKLNDLVLQELNARGSQICNCTDSQGQSLLSIAAGRDNLTLVRTLLSRSDTAADTQDKSGGTPLLWAAASGASVELLKLLLGRDDVHPNTRNKIGQTPLSLAASEGHAHVVKLLLEKAPLVDPNNKASDGSTPLALAAKHGHLDVVRLLLESPETNLERAGAVGRTVLGWAAKHGHEAIVRLLIQKGAAFNRYDDLGLTPLALAAKKGHLAVVKALLTVEGIEADSRDHDRNTPLLLAAKVGEKEVVETLLARPDVDPDAKDNLDRTALKWACRENYLDIARMLLETGKVDVNSRDRSQEEYTPLHTAADRGHFEICELLLEQPNILPDLPDIRANTPLLEAVWRGHTKIVKLLLARKDVTPDKKGDMERTPFTLAASRKCEEIFKMLLARAPEEVDINAVDVSRQNALYHACFTGSKEMVELLLARPNIDVNVQDTARDTALGIAVEYSHSEVVKLLLARDDIDPDLAYGRNVRTPLGWAAYNGHTEIVNLLLNTGKVNINHQDDEGCSPLTLVMRGNGGLELTNRMLAYEGIDVTLKDSEGRAAISFAAQLGLMESVKALLDPSKPWVGKVDLDERDIFQRTPLWWAANSNKLPMVKYLLEAGKVTVDAQDSHGTTPLCIAAWNGYLDIVNLLLWHPNVDPSIKDNDGDTVLACAAASGKDCVVRSLLAHPLVDPEERNNLGRTAFSSAAGSGFAHILPILLQYRGVPPLMDPEWQYVNPETRDAAGQTPLSIACAIGRVEVVKKLLEMEGRNKVDPNSRCDSGKTPLSYAAEHSKYEVVKILLGREDVDYFMKDNDGHTPRWWSKRLGVPNSHSSLVKGFFDHWKPGHP